MRNVSGVTGAAPIWLEVVSWLHHARPSPPISPPTGVLATRVTFPAEVEPGRTEWILRGTEPQASLQRLAEGFPRILAPVSGTVIALDPNIPPAQQRLIFEADAGNLSLRWVLDGRNLGSAARPLLWEPSPGQHTMSLVEQDRRVLDIVTFIVRDEALPPSE